MGVRLPLETNNSERKERKQNWAEEEGELCCGPNKPQPTQPIRELCSEQHLSGSPWVKPKWSDLYIPPCLGTEHMLPQKDMASGEVTPSAEAGPEKLRAGKCLPQIWTASPSLEVTWMTCTHVLHSLLQLRRLHLFLHIHSESSFSRILMGASS